MSTRRVTDEHAAAVPVPADQLARLLAQHVGPDVELYSLRRSEYTTSFPLFELEASGCGGAVRWMIKDLAWASLSAEATRVKRRSEHHPAREVLAHRSLLTDVAGPPAFIAGQGDQRGAHPWLVVEHVDGRELYQWGALEAWELAAGWLARFHQHWRGRSRQLLRHHPSLAASRLGPSPGATTGSPRPTRATSESGSDLEAVLAAWPAAARELSGVAATLSHGECYASNVLVTDRGRVAVVDWETVAIGSGWEDLAALVTGWSKAVRERLLEAYLLAAAPVPGVDPERLLDAARLQLCLRWMGVDPTWQPPPEHRNDWLAEAVRIVEGSAWDR